MARVKRQRRSKGEGTIYKTVHRGRAVYVAELEWGSLGEPVQRRSAQRTREADARAVLDQWRLELASKGSISKHRAARGPSFEEYALTWLARRKPELGANTYRQYEGNLRLHLIPALKGRALRNISQDHVSTFLGDFQSARETGARNRETGETTRKQCLQVLKQIFADAIYDEIVERMPFQTTGRRRVKMRVERRETHVLSAEQQLTFIGAASGHRLEALFVLALASGMRQGELLGLRWAHVAEDHISVQRRLDARTKVSAQTKSRSATRRIELDQATMLYLEAHRERMRREKLDVGPRSLVFMNQAGKALSATNVVRRDFRPILAAAKLPIELRFHDLRHSHATILLSSGINPKVVQERLGHESVKTTLDLYGHVLPTTQRDAATLIGQILFPPPTSRVRL